METLGLSNAGSVCRPSQSQAPKFHLTISISAGSGNGYLSLSLGPRRALCFFPLPWHQENDQQAPQLEECQTHSNCFLLASERVVPRPSGIIFRQFTETPHEERRSSSATFPQVPPQSPHGSTNRKETIKHLFQFWNYSRKVLKTVVESRKHSTTVNYQHKWNRYRRWCHKSGHSVSCPFSQKFYLHDSCHMSVSSIKGYKAMFNTVNPPYTVILYPVNSQLWYLVFTTLDSI